MPHLGMILATAALAASPPSLDPELPKSLDLSEVRALPVQHDGRWPPLDTAARHLVEQVTGDLFYQGQDPVLWLLAWSFDPAPLCSLRIPSEGDRSEEDTSEADPLTGDLDAGQVPESLRRELAGRGVALSPGAKVTTHQEGISWQISDDSEESSVRYVVLREEEDWLGGQDWVRVYDRASWKTAPLISVDKEEVRKELELPESRSVFSYVELLNHDRLQHIVKETRQLPEGQEQDPLQSKAGEIVDRLIVLQRMLIDRSIKPIPHPKDPLGYWFHVQVSTEQIEDGEFKAAVEAARSRWGDLRKAFLADDVDAFESASEELAEALEAVPAAHRPDPELIATELHYNQLRPFRVAWIIMAAAAVLAALAMGIRLKWFDAVAILALVMGFGVLTYGLWLRWQIAGRIPASNLFESLLFLSWGMGAFAIVAMLVMRDRTVPLTASAMGALALILADLLPIDSYIRPITPVLADTIWMSIHVPVIMVSYSVLALGVLIAHVQLVVMAAAPRRRQLVNAIDSLHYWYIHVGSILLIAGIITGSMWGASSWGRYWGWDPKEVWSLVAFLGYLAILHVRIDRERVPAWAYGVAAVLAVSLFAIAVPKLEPLTWLKTLALTGTAAAMLLFVLTRGQFATAVKSIVAFWMIVMTYVGVNFVLSSGLHSYGFGKGEVVRWMYLIGGNDLWLVAVCGTIYLDRGARRGSGSDPGDPAVVSPSRANMAEA